MSKELIGGQAVIEGVMMINQQKIAIACRKPNQDIIVKNDKLKKLPKIFELPFLRGIIKLFVMLYVGIKALNWSTDVSLEEEEGDMSGWQLIFMIIFAVGLAIALFKFLPLFFAGLINDKIGNNYIVFNILDGLIKIGLFIGYVSAISLMKDVKRLFMYHGAEHKAVHCRESKKELTIENVQKFPTLHKRCGSAFIMVVLTLSIITYTFIPQTTTFFGKLGFRLLLLPIIAGISYEILRASAKYNDNWFFDKITIPGIWLQKLTTKEPDDKQVEVAIRALKEVT